MEDEEKKKSWMIAPYNKAHPEKNIQLTKEGKEQLRERELMDDHTLSFLLSFAAMRAGAVGTAHAHSIISPFFMNKLTANCRDHSRAGIAARAREMRCDSLVAALAQETTLFCVANIHCNHWVTYMISVHPSLVCVRIYDSLNGRMETFDAQITALEVFAREKMSREWNEAHEWTVQMARVPAQRGVTCGMHAMFFVNALMRDSESTMQHVTPDKVDELYDFFIRQFCKD
jgi:Ulp1 family protease